jgi:hypothetical protein
VMQFFLGQTWRFLKMERSKKLPTFHDSKILVSTKFSASIPMHLNDFCESVGAKLNPVYS